MNNQEAAAWQPTEEEILQYMAAQDWPTFADLRYEHLGEEESTTLTAAVKAAQSYTQARKDDPGLSLLLVAHAAPADPNSNGNGQRDFERTGYGCGKTMLAKIVYHANSHIGFVPSTPGDLWLVPKGHYYESRQLMALFDKHDFDRRATFSEFGNLLVIDDVGREGALKWEKRDPAFQLREKQDRYYTIIDHLYERKIGLVLTSNMTSQELASFLGGASWSRLLQMAPPEYRLNLTGIRDMRPLLSRETPGRRAALEVLK